MKIGLLIGLNVLMVGAGILTYDVMQGDPGGADDTSERLAAQVDTLHERLDELEGRFDALDRNGDRRTATRLLQLEERLGAMESGRNLATAEVAAEPDADEGTAAAVAAALAARGGDPDAPLAETEIERVKQALEAVERERDSARAARMVDGLTERLGLALTDEQKRRLGEELGSFRETARDRMRETRMAGGGREEMMATFDELRGELTTNLETFLAASDAEAISAEIGSGPRAMFGGGPGRGGGGGGPGR